MTLEKGPEKPRKMTPDEILESSNHVKEIIYPNPDFLLYDGEPIEIIFKNILTNASLTKQIKKQFDEGLLGYVKAPAIIDDFEDDRDRNALENNVYDLTEDGSKLYKSNRLRITNIRHVIQLSDLMTYLQFIKEESREKLRTHIAEIWTGVADRSDESKRQDNFEKYDQMSIEDKVAFTDKVADLAKEACITLIESQQK